jgi:hypothetical protein
MKALALTKNTVDVDLVIGRYYNIEPAETGTDAQNKAFHALVQEYFNSGCFSYEAKNWLELKDQVKKNLGAGLVYNALCVDGWRNGLTWDEAQSLMAYGVVLHTAETGDFIVSGELKSWAMYTKKARMMTMDALIAEMIQAGVQTKKFEEILKGMENVWNEKNQ